MRGFTPLQQDILDFLLKHKNENPKAIIDHHLVYENFRSKYKWNFTKSCINALKALEEFGHIRLSRSSTAQNAAFIISLNEMPYQPNNNNEPNEISDSSSESEETLKPTPTVITFFKPEYNDFQKYKFLLMSGKIENWVQTIIHILHLNESDDKLSGEFLEEHAKIADPYGTDDEVRQFKLFGLLSDATSNIAMHSVIEFKESNYLGVRYTINAKNRATFMKTLIDYIEHEQPQYAKMASFQALKQKFNIPHQAEDSFSSRLSM